MKMRHQSSLEPKILRQKIEIRIPGRPDRRNANRQTHLISRKKKQSRNKKSDAKYLSLFISLTITVQMLLFDSGEIIVVIRFKVCHKK